VKALSKENPRVAFSYRTLLAVAGSSALMLTAGCAGAASPGSAGGVGTTDGAAGPANPSSSIPAKPAGTPAKLAETGSTLLYPLFIAWAKAYHRQFGSVRITTAATGSGVGIEDAAAGSADLGASDAFLSSGNLVQTPKLLNIPLAISAQQVNYNLPKLPAGTHVRLSGSVLAQIYQGAITTWNNQAIARLNPGISLPAIKIVPLHREESSGDTFLFSSYLSTNDPSWNAAIGYGTTVAWPAVPGAKAEEGNTGMVTGCEATPGCIAYIGISYLGQATAGGLGEAELENASGQFLLPDGPSMRAAVASFVPATPANETISMINGPAKDGYPVVNFEYAIVSADQRDATKARDLKAFLHWAITSGNATTFLSQVGFQPLPAPIVSLADDQIARIR
jgi:phosphate transport system substrate-binding protein